MNTAKQTTILGKKLLTIRQWKGLSQGKMLLTVMPEDSEVNRARVSQWERGTREPSTSAQIRYAKFAGITLDELLDDQNKLPSHIRKCRKKSFRQLRRKPDAFNAELLSKREIDRSSNDHKNKQEEAFQASNDQVKPIAEASKINKDSQANQDEFQGDYNAEINLPEDTPATTEKPQYRKDLLALSLAINETEKRELITFDLPSETLDRLHDLLLNLHLLIPRQKRAQLTIEMVVNFAINLIACDYQNFENKSLTAKHVDSLFGVQELTDSAQNDCK